MDNENNPEKVPISQVVDVIDVNKVHGGVDVIMNKEDGNIGNVVNEDNPEQVWPSQVVEVHTVDKDRGDVDITVENENMNMDSMNEDKSEHVSTSQVTGVINMDEVVPSQVEEMVSSWTRTTGTWSTLTPTPM